MKTNFSKLRFAFCFLLCFLSAFFIACQREDLPSLSKMSPQSYKHITGYQISVPDSWKPIAQTGAGVYFIDGSNNVSLNIISEMGGMDFYSPEELIQMVLDRLEPILQNIKTEQVMSVRDKKAQYGLVISGENNSGKVVMTTIWLYEPINGIRYYLLFSCGGDDYSQYAGVFDEVIKSLRFVANDEEVFGLLNLSKEELEEEMKAGLSKL